MAENTTKILLAEDDYAISLALKTIISNNINCELKLVHNGQDAIDAIKEEAYDLVISDWNMPIKTGQEVLEFIRSNEKTITTPFIMLTARADKDSVINAAKAGVTTYIHKPFNRDDLLYKINQVLSFPTTDAANGDSNRDTSDSGQANGAEPERIGTVDIIRGKLKNNEFSIPASSEITCDAIEALGRNDCDVADIADIIKKDAMLSSRLIAIANSRMYRGSRDSNTLDEAITRLGLKETNNYLWVLANSALYDSSNNVYNDILKKTKRHSLATAECAQLIARYFNLENPSEYFYLGLLHDIGSVLLIQILEEMDEADRTRDNKDPYSIIDELHNEFGAELLGLWGMPDRIINVALHHGNPDASEDYVTELNVICIANIMAMHLGYEVSAGNKKPDGELYSINDLMELPSAKKLGVTPELVSELQEEVPKYMKSMSNLL